MQTPTNNPKQTTATPKSKKPIKATFEALMEVAKLSPAARRKLMQSLAQKTEAEQLIIFGIRNRIFSRISTSSEQQTEVLRKLRTEEEYIASYDYYVLLLATRIYMSTATKSRYISKIREARQKTESLKTISLARAVEVLLPLIDELRSAGATWDEIANVLNTKQKKVLCNRKLSVDYLKKTYGKLKKATP